MQVDRQKFALLRPGRRLWAVGAIHGEAQRLRALHDGLVERLAPGDRLVYLGNLIGHGGRVAETLDELIAFRAAFLSRPKTFCCDIAHLRGSQEEIWQKLLQLQFATDPRGVLAWMLENGVAQTLEAYGGSVEEAERTARAGTVQLTRWTNGLRQSMQARPGHYDLLGSLRRAAVMEDAILCVHAGLDPARPLDAQKDTFWWGGGFSRIDGPYGAFKRVVRGFSPEHPGLKVTDHTATVDGGCGFGGPLIAACFTADGELADQVEA